MIHLNFEYFKNICDFIYQQWKKVSNGKRLKESGIEPTPI